MARNHEIVLWVEWLEKKGLLDQAKEQGLTFPDFLRTKLGLSTRKGDKPKPYEGDPENAVDVEELAKKLHDQWSREMQPYATMANARLAAKRRLRASREG